MKKTFTLLLIFSLLATKAQICFQQGTTLPFTGALPHAVADFNRDGNLDIAVPTATSNTVGVRLGNGAGAFGAPVYFATDSNAQAAASADFNGDSVPDIAIACYQSNTVSVLLGNGAGGFFAAVNYPVSTRPLAIITGDFNNDGKMDIATANSFGNNISVLINNGNGSFGAAINTNTGFAPHGLSAADFNNDGNLDIAVANSASNNVSVLTGSGNGNFVLAANIGPGTMQPTGVIAADLNNDGKIDIAVTHYNSNKLSVFMALGNAIFDTARLFTVSRNPYAIVSADFNGDGKPDLACANVNGNNVSILAGDGTGNFAAADSFAVGQLPFGIAVGDFNGDCKPDIIASNLVSDNVSVLLNCNTAVIRSTLATTLCSGRAITVGIHTYSVAGTYVDTLSTTTGCDSIVTLNLAINPVLTNSFNANICNGSTYSFNGQLLAQPGTYNDTLTGLNGCDSIVILNLTVNPTIAHSFNVSICNGDAYNFNGHMLQQPGNYNDTLTAVNGCDSVITLNLSVKPIQQSTFNDSICDGNFYTFNGASLSAAGQYTETLQSLSGCDSIVTLNLVIRALPMPVITRHADTLITQTYSSYQWLKNDTAIADAVNQTLIVAGSGSYSVIAWDINGCSDTSAILNVVQSGISEGYATFGIKLAPNPNSGVFILEFNDDNNREIEVTDMTGRVVFKGQAHRKKFVDLGVPDGIYLLNIREKSGANTLKFCVAK